MLVGHTIESSTAAAREIESTAGGSSVTIVPAECDLGHPESVARFAQQIVNRFPRIDILVLNAGDSVVRRRQCEE